MRQVIKGRGGGKKNLTTEGTERESENVRHSQTHQENSKKANNPKCYILPQFNLCVLMEGVLLLYLFLFVEVFVLLAWCLCHREKC